jgi:hypothetical protein
VVCLFVVCFPSSFSKTSSQDSSCLLGNTFISRAKEMMDAFAETVLS